MDALGKPHIELQHDMKLWWVHNEATLATLHAYKNTRDEKFARWFQLIHDYSFNHYPDKEFGEWYAYCNRQGQVTHSLKGGKWKTFFHVPRALLFAADLLKNM